MLSRILLLAVLFSVVFTVFIARLAQLQLLRGEDYASEVYEARFRVEVVPARRGRIIDRNGLVIADNRTVYDLAVVLQDLALSGRVRGNTPLWSLDSEQLNLLSGALAAELGRPLALVRQQLIDELVLNPGVALRKGPREEAISMGLLALPRGVLLQSDQSADPAVEPGWDILASSGVLLLDPRQAVAEEYRLRLGEELRLLDSVQWTRFIQRLATHFATQPDYIAQVLLPFAPEIELKDFPAVGEELRWRAMASTRQLQAEQALARLVGVPLAALREEFENFFLLEGDQLINTSWLYVPSARIGALAEHLPSGTPVREIMIEGLLPVRERIYLVQGETPGDGDSGMYQQILQRLQASLELPSHLGSDWLAAQIQRHGTRLSLRQAERDHRRHHIVFSGQALQRLCQSLARELRGSSQALSPLAIEQRLTQIRRLADRDWRGQTRYDALPIVEDVEANIANTLSGMGTAIPRALAKGFEETEPLLPGLRVVTGVGREYLYPGSASHLIGYLGKLSSVFDTSTALAMGLNPEGWVGRSGLEAEYDELLQGSNGRSSYLRTPEGQRLLESVDPIPGVDIHLTLDMEIQRVAERSCQRWHELATELGLNNPRMDAARERVNHQRAAMVLVDVNDGAILALASSPSYNLYDIRTRYKELADTKLHPGQPLIDHSTNASQPPGSTMKPLVAMIALSQGVTQPDEVIFSRGYMARTASGQPILREHQPFSPRDYTIPQALAQSSNVVAATWAERAGPAALTSWMRQFGFGERQAIDVGWQRPGILPTPENIARVRPSEPTWYPSDTWRAGIGQFASTSPLQVVAVPVAVATGGKIIRPYLWRDALSQRDLPPLDPSYLPVSPAAIASVQRGMEMVTDYGGTATRMKLDGALSHIEVAAKTGTSEWGTPATRNHTKAMNDPNMVWTPSHGWLIGYAPADKPRVAFAVYVYGGTSGGRACTGIAKAVLESYFTKYPASHNAVVSPTP